MNQPLQTVPGGVGIWEHFTVRDGLPDMKIESLFVDSRGDLWVGTHDRGVARFDGDSFEMFTRKDGLAGDCVLSIIEDREDALWFGTTNGLTRYRNGEFEPVVPSSGEQCYFGYGRCMDQEGTLWFGIQQHQPGSLLWVGRWDGKSLDLIPLTDVTAFIYRIVVDAKGNLWLGRYDGLYCYDGETFHVITAPFGSFDAAVALLPRADGSLWISSRKGLYVYADGQVKQLLEDTPVALVEDSAGIVWLTTFDGQFLCYDGGTFRRIQKLNVKFWRDLCFDKMGRLWMATYGMGLYCYDATRFEVFGEEQGFPSNNVYCLAEDSTGALLAGTEKGLVRYDGVVFCPLEGTVELTGSIPVTSLLRDHRDRLWIGAYCVNSLLYRYEGEVLQPVPIPTKTERGDWILASLAEDKSGRIWFGFQQGYGFGYYENGQVRRFLSDCDVTYPSYVGGLVVDRQGAVWIGSWDPARWEGLCRYDGKDFTHFTQADGLVGGAILALYEDREGSLWIGTSAGVSRYDGENFTTFTKADGLLHEIVTAITQSEDGTLWFGTEGGGVCHYDGQVFQVITIPGEPGFNVIHAILIDRMNQVWLGTEGGLVRYTPWRVPPEVVITGVLADRFYEAIQPIEVPTTVGRISFSFQGRSPVERGSHLIYRVWLEGYDAAWRQTRERQVDYLSLPPGEYGFHVQAVDRDLNYSEMAKVQVRVTPDPSHLRIRGLNEVLRSAGAPGEFIGSSPALERLLSQIHRVAGTDLTVLIEGETGSGKGLVARAIHGLSARQREPFIPVNCGAIPEGLVESELFGHEKGAFTGAVSRKLGRVELAEEGTLFLDEIGDLALGAQVKLLRFLEDRTFQRVGGEKDLRADVRVVAATNRDLKQMVSGGGFREDLFYRLQEFVIRVPPLRERLEDVPLLVRYFAERFAGHLSRPIPGIGPGVMEHLKGHTWPGNVRELEHVVQQAVLACEDNVMGLEEVSGVLRPEREVSGGRVFLPMEEMERRYLEEVLEVTGWVIYGPQGAAKRLGMHPEKLRYRMKKLGVRRPSGVERRA